MDKTFNKNDFFILAILKKEKCVNTLESLTAKKIQSHTNLSYSKIKTSLRDFIEVGYVAEGMQQAQAKTYYITEKGLKELNRLGI